ncbi:MAG: FAD-dependent oxidoreductase, partial [Enterococcus sp.]|nr:FAD-dependent oxidoreductase [Enterococcus sp.]
MAQKIVVVGAYVAGYNVVKELRKKGYDGEITLISNQEVLPYDLKPLSKDWMLDQTDLTPPIFTGADYYSDKNIQVQLQTTIEQINPADKTIRTQQGALIAYDKLVIAIGSTLRRLTVPGVEAEGIFYLRDYAHAKKMKEWRQNAKELVIVGAGFIGLEMASTFAQLGLKVTVIEHADYPLGRILGKEASSYFRKMHESHGVTFLTGEDLQAFEQDESGRVKAAVTASGKEIPCQMAIIGIGVVPNTSLTHPDLKVERGIVVNEFGETSLPDVYAAGDCTVWPYHGQPIHVEHWEHAWA